MLHDDARYYAHYVGKEPTKFWVLEAGLQQTIYEWDCVAPSLAVCVCLFSYSTGLQLLSNSLVQMLSAETVTTFWVTAHVQFSAALHWKTNTGPTSQIITVECCIVAGTAQIASIS